MNMKLKQRMRRCFWRHDGHTLATLRHALLSTPKGPTPASSCASSGAKKFLLLLFLIFFTACTTTANDNLLTEDGTLIAYTYTPAERKDTGFVLLHMLNRNRHDYENFASFLASKGYPSIAIDLRGHGNSQGNWQQYTPKEFNTMTQDAQAGIEYLKRHGINKIILVGASIGANIAINTATQDQQIHAAVLLSPGFNYRGITTQEAAQQTKTPVLLIAAEDDPDSAAVTYRLQKLIKAPAERIVYQKGGHGTHLLENQKTQQDILNWIQTI